MIYIGLRPKAFFDPRVDGVWCNIKNRDDFGFGQESVMLGDLIYYGIDIGGLK